MKGFYHLELVFLASTLTPAWGAGWASTTTTAPAPRPAQPGSRPPAPVRLRLAVLSS